MGKGKGKGKGKGLEGGLKKKGKRNYIKNKSLRKKFEQV
jgi:hypothetical protein